MAPPTIVGAVLGSTSTSPLSYTTDAAADFLLAFTPVGGITGTPSLSATYNVVSMTTLQSNMSGDMGTDWMSLHRLVAPDTGARDYAYTEGGGGRYGSALIGLDGVDQTTPLTANTPTYSGGATTVAGSVSSTADDLCLFFVMAFSTATLTAGSGETIELTFDLDSGSYLYIISKAGSAGTVNFAPTFVASQSYYAWAVSVAGATSTTPLGKPGNFAQGKPFTLNQSPSNGKLMRITNG